MSQQRRRFAVDALPDPWCLFCGESFDPDEGRECPALDEGDRRPRASTAPFPTTSPTRRSASSRSASGLSPRLQSA